MFSEFQYYINVEYILCNGGIIVGPDNAKCLMLPVVSNVILNISSRGKSESIFVCIFSFRIINIVILVSLLSFALGFQHQIKVVHAVTTIQCIFSAYPNLEKSKCTIYMQSLMNTNTILYSGNSSDLCDSRTL